MSMITRRGQNSGNESKLPRAPAVPAPAPAPAPYYDEEVLRVAQRDFDNKRAIATLENERDEWRRKCLAAEEDNGRLESRLDRNEQAHATEIAHLTDQRDRKIEELTEQRDLYKLRLARFETQIMMVGEGLIKLASSTSEMVSKLLEEIRAESGRPDTAGIAALAAVADAVAANPATPRQD